MQMTAADSKFQMKKSMLNQMLLSLMSFNKADLTFQVKHLYQPDQHANILLFPMQLFH